MHSSEPSRGRSKTFGTAFGSDNSVEDGKGLQKIIAASKTSGALNLSNRQLQEVPQDVFASSENDDSVKWWEAVDLTKLDLSHNHITQLPQQLYDLNGLVTLLASNNAIQQLLPGINTLQSLRMLDLSDNPLGPSLPEDVALLPSLASFNCSNCGLEVLPDALGGAQQPKLSSVNVSGNALVHLPSGLCASGSLVVLKASNNQLGQLPDRLVQGWRSLKELDVSHNQLKELPAALGSLPALAHVDARNNQLGALPGGLGDAAALLELRLGFNQLTTLPASLGMLRSLKTLDLRNNLIEELHDALCSLQLHVLDLTNNCLRRLPPSLGHMTTLRSMPLDGNPLKLMRRELWAGPVSALLQHLRDQEQASNTPAQPVSSAVGQVQGAMGAGCGQPVDGAVSLRGTGLTCLPDAVLQAGSSVTSLELSDNNLAAATLSLAAGLAQLPALKLLSLNNCSLNTWPLVGLGPGSLQALHTLELAGNSFGRSCPQDGLAPCPRLKTLDLSGVRGLQLPDGIFAATTQLQVLVVCRAGLTDVPRAVLGAANLTRLSLSGNSLSSVPVEATVLRKLQELDLSNNQLSNLPPQMGLMAPTLRVLMLDGNCIRAIRRPVLEKGTASVLEWLKDRITI